MALTKVTGQVINTTTDLVVGVTTVGGGISATDAYFSGITTLPNTEDSSSTSTGSLIVAGGVGIAKNLSIGGSVSIGGTLTYEDVTNVDSVGLITARNGVSVTGGTIKVGSGITLSTDGNLYTTGIATIYNGFSGGAASNVDSAIVLDNDSHSYVQFRTPANKEQGLLFGDDADNDAGAITYVHSTNHLGFRVNAAERIRITSDGYFGVGQTPTTMVGVTLAAQVADGTDDGADWGAGGIFQLNASGTAAAGNEILLAGAHSGGLAQVASGIGFGRHNTSDWGTYLSFKTHAADTSNIDSVVERVRITSAGKVGINDTNPNAMLSISHAANAADGIQVQNTNNSQGSAVAQVLIMGGDNAYGSLKLECNGTNHSIQQDGNGHLKFVNASTERLRIASNGNVSIGNNPTVAADTIFHVEKTSGECNVYFEGDTSTLGARLILKNNNTAAGAMNAIAFADAGGQSTCGIDAYNYDQTNNRGYLSFTTREGAGAAPINRMTIDRCPTMEVGIVTTTGAFCGTVNKAFKYSQPTPGEQNIPYNTWTTISTDYGWVLPSAGTYKLTSGNRVKLWETTGYIQTRLWDNTASNAISATLRMMFEQNNSTSPVGRYNVHINNVWVITIPTARTIYQQYNTNNNSANSTIQDDVNGRNYYMWERIG